MKYKIVKIHTSAFIDILKHGIYNNVRVVSNALPEDAKFIRAFTNDTSGWGYISLVIESELFPEIQEGDLMEVLPYPIFEKVM